MATTSAAIAPAAIERYRFRVDDYCRMTETGILDADARVELLDGEIVHMTPIGSEHGSVVDRLTHLFVERLREQAIVRVQGAVRLDDFSQVQPDVTLLRPRADFYRTRHPGPADVLLLIEVADTSLAKDEQVKLPLYARAGIGEVWIIGTQAGRLSVYRQPDGQRYATVLHPGRKDSVAPLALPDQTLAVLSLLGR